MKENAAVAVQAVPTAKAAILKKRQSIRNNTKALDFRGLFPQLDRTAVCL